jgi:hypothetical protein
MGSKQRIDDVYAKANGYKRRVQLWGGISGAIIAVGTMNWMMSFSLLAQIWMLMAICISGSLLTAYTGYLAVRALLTLSYAKQLEEGRWFRDRIRIATARRNYVQYAVSAEEKRKQTVLDRIDIRLDTLKESYRTR